MHTRIERIPMKLLKIDEGKGYFLGEDTEDQPVDKLTKEDLLRMVDLTLTEDEILFDEYDENSLHNQAHQIIYKNVYEKLHFLRERRSEFVDESERLFLEEYDSYRAAPAAEDNTPPSSPS